MELKVLYRFQKSPPLDSSHRQINPIHTLVPYFTFHFNIIITPTPISFKKSLEDFGLKLSWHLFSHASYKYRSLQPLPFVHLREE